jgi:hypothetical protein
LHLNVRANILKIIAKYIILLSCSSSLQGQEDTIIFDPIDFSKTSTQYVPNIDLTEHRFWKNYLIGCGKKSILTDSTISEAYRLVYWGNYFSIIEIIKHQDLYYLTADSSSWGTRNYLVNRSHDTLSMNCQLQFIYQYCNIHKQDTVELDVSKEDSFSLDDRDTWAFEYKIGEYYRSIEGIETSKELETVYSKLMNLGKLTGYRIYLINGGYNDY